MKTAQYPPAPLRREIALDVGDDENQETEQHRNLQHIVEEKPDAPSHASAHIQPQQGKPSANQFIQPFHAQYLVLDQFPYAHEKTSFPSHFKDISRYFDVSYRRKRHPAMMAFSYHRKDIRLPAPSPGW